LLRDNKTKLKISRQDENQLKKRERPEASGPLDAIKSGSKVNKKDGKYFNIWYDSEESQDQLTIYLKKEDLEWLGFNWFRLRVGLLVLEG
jgi:hypothetical protein